MSCAWVCMNQPSGNRRCQALGCSRTAGWGGSKSQAATHRLPQQLLTSNPSPQLSVSQIPSRSCPGGIRGGILDRGRPRSHLGEGHNVFLGIDNTPGKQTQNPFSRSEGAELGYSVSSGAGGGGSCAKHIQDPQGFGGQSWDPAPHCTGHPAQGTHLQPPAPRDPPEVWRGPSPESLCWLQNFNEMQ